MRFFPKTIFHLLAIGGIFWLLHTNLLAGHVTIEGGVVAYLFLAILFTIINLIIKPILQILTLPIRFLTLGMFGIVINVFLLWLLIQLVVWLDMAGVVFAIHDWVTLFLAGTILGLGSMILHWFER